MNSPINQLLDTIQYEDLEKGENVTDGELYAGALYAAMLWSREVDRKNQAIPKIVILQTKVIENQS